MGKAIAFVSFVLVCSIVFVMLQLWRQSPRASEAAPASGPPVLQTLDDGSLYSVGLKLERFERRLMEEEQRSQQLLDELNQARQDRTDLSARVEELQGEIRRLRRELAAGAGAGNAPANTPPGNTPSAIPPPPGETEPDGTR
jgi:septal ring factor EnvC (AmiA/AmiB activator)